LKKQEQGKKHMVKKILKKKMQMRRYDGDFGFNTRASNVFYSGRETSPAVLFGDYDRDSVPNVIDCNPLNPNEQGFLGSLMGAIKGIGSGFAQQQQKSKRQILTKSVPKEQLRQIMARKQLARLAFPVIPAAALPGAERGTQKKGGEVKGYASRGRPVGSYDPRYAAYGGVFGYRRALSARKSLERVKQQLEEEKIRQIQAPRVQAVPSQFKETQAALLQRQLKQLQAGVPPEQIQGLDMPEQQIPQEVEGATPDYSQFQEMQQQQMQEQVQMPQVQQQPFEYLQQERPVGRVFRSYGGSPYPPVDRRPIAPSQQIPGYIETVDAFTGRRYLKPKPRPEKWATGGN
jgi:hypothetical protein